jgi:hypothetical protein
MFSSSIFRSVVAIGVLSMPFVAQAQTAEQSNIIENVVAVFAAESYCGQTVNQQVLGIVLSASGLRPEDLSSGGRYYSTVVRDRERVRQLVSTDSGKSSFCRRVSTELSAMFD